MTDVPRPQAAASDWAAAVAREPWAHDFFALLRRLEALHPEHPRLGAGRRPRQEPVRLGEAAELDFAPAAVASLDVHGRGAPRLGVRFFGLLGPNGPMPLHLTEFVRERARHRGDTTAVRFLDVFHHRLLLLFYRAWAQAQPAVQRDRPGEDRYAVWLGSAIGWGDQAGRDAVLPDTALLYQAGLGSSRSAHPEALEKVVRQYFRVGARVEAFRPQRLRIDEADRSRLGHARNRPERALLPAAALGRSANAGRHVYDRQYRFRLHVGPLTRAQYDAFLPDGAAWPQLAAWVPRLAGVERTWDAKLILRGDHVPAPRLGRVVRLGLTAWIGRHATPPGDRSDVRLAPGSSFLLRRRGTPDG